jgi:hypothetical protein
LSPDPFTVKPKPPKSKSGPDENRRLSLALLPPVDPGDNIPVIADPFQVPNTPVIV